MDSLWEWAWTHFALLRDGIGHWFTTLPGVWQVFAAIAAAVILFVALLEALGKLVGYGRNGGGVMIGLTKRLWTASFKWWYWRRYGPRFHADPLLFDMAAGKATVHVHLENKSQWIAEAWWFQASITITQKCAGESRQVRVFRGPFGDAGKSQIAPKETLDCSLTFLSHDLTSAQPHDFKWSLKGWGFVFPGNGRLLSLPRKQGEVRLHD